MAGTSRIEWTDVTWNPVTGCKQISPGCDHCYAARFAERFRGVPGHPYSTGFDVTVHESRFEQPLRWKKPRHVFVNSMSDLFHKAVGTDTVDRIFEVMETADRHIFQILTKRSGRMLRYFEKRYADQRGPEHIWCGVSVEDRKRQRRIEHLRRTPAGIRFLSVEPLLEQLDPLDLQGIHWVIVGGESGPRARPMKAEWVRTIQAQCEAQSVAFFFKQWGGPTPKAGGRELDGQIYDEMPRRTNER